jgi:hypothetical protein
MAHQLPTIIYEDILPTRDYLREICLVLGSIQRTFLAKDPHDWHYGLVVNVRGIVTQSFMTNEGEMNVSLDLVRHKVRVGNTSWALSEYTPLEIYNNLAAWFEHHAVSTPIISPKFTYSPHGYSDAQATGYAQALWWLNSEFMKLKDQLSEGFTSPIYLYPHHFDLSLVWFPFSDERQLAIGFSTGDDVISEPYLYLTAFPQLHGFHRIAKPDEAYFQTTGFSGLVLPYSYLSESRDPHELFTVYGLQSLLSARKLFS